MEIGLSELVTPRQFMNRAIQLARVGEGVEKLAPGIMCNRTTLTLSRRYDSRLVEHEKAKPRATARTRLLMRFIDKALGSFDRKRITLRGIMVDQVTEVLQSPWQFCRNQREIGFQKAYFEALEWIGNSQLLRKGAPVRIQTMDESLMRCLTAGITKHPTGHVPDKEELERSFALLITFLHLKKEDQTIYHHLNKTQLRDLLTAMNSACYGRKIFSTSNGLVGLGDRLTQPGDNICVFRTCKMPLVLRKEPSEKVYKLLGPAYVDGIMYGEALEMEMRGIVQEEYFEIV